MTEKPLPDSVAAQRERLVEGLGAYGACYDELSRRFAAWLGLYATDAAALLEIASAEQRGVPLSPGRLGERIPLSSGATTTLLNRLERAGHIVRTREHPDRRIVTLHSSQHIQERADRFFSPLAERLDVMMSRYSPELRQQFETFLADLCATMQAHLTQDNPEI